MTWTLFLTGPVSVLAPAPAVAGPLSDEGGRAEGTDAMEWFPDDQRFDAERAMELDYKSENDAFFVPTIGARWFGEGPGGALAVGIGGGGWQRWSSALSRADIGATMLLYYEGYDGAARGRSLRLSSRLVLGGGPVHLKVGGDVATSRHRFDFRPNLEGVLTGGPAVDLTIAHDGLGWVGGGSADWFLQQGVRPAQAEDSPLAGISDEFSWYAGFAWDGSVVRYAQQWNAEGPMHLVVSTTLY